MSETETTVYPTDILKSKYRTVLEAAEICKCSVQTILSAIKADKLRWAEFKVPGKRCRVVHVNPEELSKYLEDHQDVKR